MTDVSSPLLSKEVCELKKTIAAVISTPNISYTIKLRSRTSEKDAGTRMRVTIYKLPLKKLGALRWAIFCTHDYVYKIGVIHVKRHELLQCYIVDGKPLVVVVRTRNIIKDIHNEILRKK